MPCCPPLEAAERLSHRLKALAEQGAWGALEEVMEARARLLDEAFAAPIPPEAAPQARRHLEAILALDEATRALLEGERQRLGERLEALHLGRRAHLAYGEHG